MSQPVSLAAALPTPRMIVQRLDRSVVGQDRAKCTLAVAVANHHVRLFDVLDWESAAPTVTDASLRQVVIEKSNVLLIGPSGSGKTHLARALAECLDVPFAVADATTLTEAGYVGDDVETVLHKLLMAAGGDVAEARQGIVFIDEIDKLGGDRVHGTKDMRLGVQHALLRMIEGTVANVPPSGGYKVVGETCVPFDTSNVLFICGGAFVGLEEIVARRIGRRASFGFEQAGSTVGDEAENPLHNVLPEDVEGFGLIPELLGRLPIIATLDDLGVEDLARILREPTNSLLAQYRKLLKYRHTDLELTDGAIREIAKMAHERGNGARGLRAVVERVLEPVLFDPRPWTTARITEATVRGGEVEYDPFGLPGAAPLRHRIVRRSATGS
ncbi:ATP-dependent Clp protease ATP-binding subunit ClpX [Planctomyces sp. SH-PL62]|uniref:ATP-dependent Clp protease ATP-binding subunit ClpX n=1 Tax=Planctomyces sp. SH-PL62 TaxID=1636152 RepID=UPI00078E39BC|nr:ATP-dependent Clp protease ATP-binding subunit ClpX [Planctomyces sp. SH-PL62]AMV40222.1 ATP-dependent Clp protease ATP-binding subunit ClpX [Planctomyces sp. SH-PL62]